VSRQAGGSSLKNPQPAVPAPQRDINLSGLAAPDNFFIYLQILYLTERKNLPAPGKEMKTGRSSRPDQEGVKLPFKAPFHTR
jgi:hypothetical protein